MNGLSEFPTSSQKGIGSETEQSNSIVGPEQKKFPEAVVDARDYFRDTAFQKEAEELDPDKSHRWQTARGAGVLVRDDYGKVALAETFDAEEPDRDNRVGLLLAEQDKDGRGSSAYVRNELNPAIRGRIVDIVNDVSPRLNGENRHTFVRALIQLLPTLEKQSEEVVTETLNTLVLKLVPDHPSGVEANEIPHIGAANAQQQEQLVRLITLASKKMSPENFSQRLSQFQDNLQRMDDSFGRNYVNLLSDIRSWVLDSREDTKRNFEALRRTEPIDYLIGDKITREFSSQDELEQILRALPVERMPDITFAQRSRVQAEFVDLERVVGGTGIDNWTVSTSQGRGLEKIYQLSQALKDGSASVVGNNQPIKVVEMDGKYFVEADGRHRTAALKALGVARAPMLVTHIRQ
jgi:hypothetical protein